MTQFYFPTHVVWLLAKGTAYTHSVQFESGTRVKGFVIGPCISKSRLSYPRKFIHIALLRAFARISSLQNSLGSEAAHKQKSIFLVRSIRKIAESYYYFRHVRSHRTLGTSGQIFIKCDIWIFFEIYRKKSRFINI